MPASGFPQRGQRIGGGGGAALPPTAEAARGVGKERPQCFFRDGCHLAQQLKRRYRSPTGPGGAARRATRGGSAALAGPTGAPPAPHSSYSFAGASSRPGVRFRRRGARLPGRRQPRTAGGRTGPPPASSPARPKPPHLLVFAEHFLQQVPGTAQGGGAAQRPAPRQHRRRPGAPHAAAAARRCEPLHGGRPAVPAPPRGAAARGCSAPAVTAMLVGGPAGPGGKRGRAARAQAQGRARGAGGQLVNRHGLVPRRQSRAQALLVGELSWT